jgi:hypothetical protein
MSLAYSILLPQPWVCVPVDGDVDTELARLVEAPLGNLPAAVDPDQRRQLQGELSARLGRALADARGSGAIDLYLPSQARHGLLASASFVVAEISPPLWPIAQITAQSYAPLVMAELCSQAGADTVRTADAVWVRTERIEPPGDEVDVMSVVVTYLSPMPGEAESWVAVSFSTFGDGNPDSEPTRLVVDLFDAIMSTWEWSDS